MEMMKWMSLEKNKTAQFLQGPLSKVFGDSLKDIFTILLLI